MRAIELWAKDVYTVVPEALYQQVEGMTEALAVFYSRLMDNYLYFTTELKHKNYHPTATELSFRFNIDVKTVRNRLKALETFGLIIREKNSGYADNITVVNFKELDLITLPSAKELITEHREERKEQRATEKKEWLEKQANVVEVEEPVVFVQAPEPIVVEPTPVIHTVEEAVLSDKQIEYYCSITDTDFDRTKSSLLAEPSAGMYMLEVIAEHSNKKAEDGFFKSVANKANPHYKGHIPQTTYSEDLDSPF